MKILDLISKINIKYPNITPFNDRMQESKSKYTHINSNLKHINIYSGASYPLQNVLNSR